MIAEEVDLDENNGYLEDDDHTGGSRRTSDNNVEEQEEEEEVNTIISWEMVISLLAAVVRILFEVLT